MLVLQDYYADESKVMVVIPTLWLVKLKVNRIFHSDAFPYVGPSPDVNTSFHPFGPSIKSKRGDFFHTFESIRRIFSINLNIVFTEAYLNHMF